MQDTTTCVGVECLDMALNESMTSILLSPGCYQVATTFTIIYFTVYRSARDKTDKTVIINDSTILTMEKLLRYHALSLLTIGQIKIWSEPDKFIPERYFVFKHKITICVYTHLLWCRFLQGEKQKWHPCAFIPMQLAVVLII